MVVSQFHAEWVATLTKHESIQWNGVTMQPDFGTDRGRKVLRQAVRFPPGTTGSGPPCRLALHSAEQAGPDRGAISVSTH